MKANNQKRAAGRGRYHTAVERMEHYRAFPRPTYFALRVEEGTHYTSAMSDQRWKRFEKLAAKIQEELAPSAKVVHDEKIPGRKSGTDRQIDISVRQRVGQFNLLIVIECKDYKVPVDVGDVGQFIDMVRDVGAQKGAIVSASGFSEASKRRAAEAGIDLFRLVDAESEDWRTYVRAGFLWHFKVLKGVQFFFTPGWDFLTTLADPASAQLYDGEGRPLGSPMKLVPKRWNADLLPRQVGNHDHLTLHGGPTFLKHDGRFFPIKVEANIEVEDELYFGYVPLDQIRGFQNVTTGGIMTRRFKTQWISTEEIRSSWRRLDDKEALAVKAVLEVDSTLLFPLDDNGEGQDAQQSQEVLGE
jgi:hypothetical protein